MNRPITIAAMLFAASIALPAAAHHGAEGIVSDEIYAAIEANLEDADSPHLDLTSEDLMGGMMITVTVDADYVDLVLEGISDGLTGSGAMRESSVDVTISPEDSDGLVTITIIEDFGQGESQMNPLAETDGML